MSKIPVLNENRENLESNLEYEDLHVNELMNINNGYK